MHKGVGNTINFDMNTGGCMRGIFISGKKGSEEKCQWGGSCVALTFEERDVR